VVIADERDGLEHLGFVVVCARRRPRRLADGLVLDQVVDERDERLFGGLPAGGAGRLVDRRGDLDVVQARARGEERSSRSRRRAGTRSPRWGKTCCSD
jgi:hypothetical protein